MTIEIEELKEKIERVKRDIAGMDDLRGRLTLTDYLDYLKDELRMLENAERSGKSVN